MDGRPGADAGLDGAPDLPGLAVRRRTGPGAAWVAQGDDGSWVVVRPGSAPRGLPDDRHLIPVLTTVHDAAGRPWSVSAYVPGGSLAQRLARVGGVPAVTAAAWGRDLAAGLAALHEAGFTLGGLRIEQVWLGPADRAMLDPSHARAGSPLDQRSDVVALAELVHRIAGASAPVAGSSTATRSRTRRAARVAGASVAAAGALVAAVALGARWVPPAPDPVVLAPEASTAGAPADEPARPPSPAPPTTPEPSTPPDPRSAPRAGWDAVLARLDARRSVAFETGRARALAAADAPGSRALKRDRRTLEQLVDRGARAEGYRTRLLSVTEVATTPGGVRLRVVDARPAYRLVDRQGRVLAAVAARGPVAWWVDLAHGPGGWRIADVRPGSASPS